MTYMQRNVNMLLLLLILVAIGALVGLTTLYQHNYKNLSESYEDTATELLQVKTNFSQKLSELNATTTQLELTSGDKQKLNSLYQGLNEVNDQLEGDLTERKTQLDDALSLLTRTQKELEDARYALIKDEEQIALLTSLTNNQKQEIKNLKDEKSDLKTENCDLHKQIDANYNC
jgi:chromosome segregation ATPase